MALVPVTHIEGLDSAYDDLEMMDDTPIGATRVKFFLKSEDMPALSEKEGRVVRHNFVWIEKIVNLGNLIIHRRCKDSVEYDSESGKWKVKKLASGMESDIRQYSAEWNAFCRGASDDMVGTPLSFLFKNDPSKVELYKSKHVHSIEQLSHFTDAHIQECGIGGKQDVEMARYYLKKIQEQAPAIELHNKFEEKDREITLLRKQLQEQSALLTKLVEHQGQGGEPVARKSRAKAKKTEIIEGEE